MGSAKRAPESQPGKAKKQKGQAASEAAAEKKAVADAVHPTVELIQEALRILKSEFAQLAKATPCDSAGIASFDFDSYRHNLRKHGEYECTRLLTDMNSLHFTHKGIPPGLGADPSISFRLRDYSCSGCCAVSILAQARSRPRLRHSSRMPRGCGPQGTSMRPRFVPHPTRTHRPLETSRP